MLARQSTLVRYASFDTRLLPFFLNFVTIYCTLSSPSGKGSAHLPHFGKVTTASYSISPMNLSHLEQRTDFMSEMFIISYDTVPFLLRDQVIFLCGNGST